MAPYSSTVAWKIPWMEEPGRLQSMGSLRVGHDWATSLFSLSCIGEGNGNPVQYSCLENPRDRGACWAAVYGVAQSWTRLMWLSSSSRASQCQRTAWDESLRASQDFSQHASFPGLYGGLLHFHIYIIVSEHQIKTKIVEDRGSFPQSCLSQYGLKQWHPASALAPQWWEALTYN